MFNDQSTDMNPWVYWIITTLFAASTEISTHTHFTYTNTWDYPWMHNNECEAYPYLPISIPLRWSMLQEIQRDLYSLFIADFSSEDAMLHLDENIYITESLNEFKIIFGWMVQARPMNQRQEDVASFSHQGSHRMSQRSVQGVGVSPQDLREYHEVVMSSVIET